jgi:poly-gamma-glutamate synthesis protein (capsule biosynthesis protein)
MQDQLEQWSQVRTLRICFGGDLMIGRLVGEYLEQNPDHSIWGDLKPYLERCDINIVNLETTLTTSDKKVEKVFNFKAHPKCVKTLLDAPIHAINLANNHILDYSLEGALETLESLDRTKIPHVGFGQNREEAISPVILEKRGVRIGLLGCTDNEPTWKPNTFYIEVGDLEAIKKTIEELRQKVDILILSIHWGPNMRTRPTKAFQAFAHSLIDLGVDIIHGHSAHIFQGVEVYKNRLILYDTGDLVDDYMIDPLLRNDLSFLFIVEVDKKGPLSLKLIPTRIENFEVNLAKGEDAEASLLKMQDLSFCDFNKKEGKLMIKLPH